MPLPLADGTRGVLADGVTDAEAAVEALGLPEADPDSVAVGDGVGVTVGVTLRVTGGGEMLEGRDGRVERGIKVHAKTLMPSKRSSRRNNTMMKKRTSTNAAQTKPKKPPRKRTPSEIVKKNRYAGCASVLRHPQPPPTQPTHPDFLLSRVHRGIAAIPVAVRVLLPLADGIRVALWVDVADVEAVAEGRGLPVTDPDDVAVGVGVGVSVGLGVTSREAVSEWGRQRRRCGGVQVQVQGSAHGFRL